MKLQTERSEFYWAKIRNQRCELEIRTVLLSGAVAITSIKRGSAVVGNPSYLPTKTGLNGSKSNMNFLKTWIVSLNILPNCLQNDQIHVTGDRGIVLMRNLLPPGCPLSVFVPDFCLYFSPCFPFNLHSLATQCKISGSWTNHKHSATSLSSKKFSSFEEFDIMCEIRRLAEQFCFLPLIDLLEMQKCPKVEMIDWENWLRS